LLSQLKEMQQKLHSPPCWADTEVVITSGSQDGLCKAFEMMLNMNDHVIIQEPVYAGTLAIVCKII
jgi:kynurenine/2-aminoadipate aminotransferase